MSYSFMVLRESSLAVRGCVCAHLAVDEGCSLLCWVIDSSVHGYEWRRSTISSVVCFVFGGN